MKPNIWVVLGALLSFAAGIYVLPVQDGVKPQKVAQVHALSHTRLASAEVPVK